MFDMVQELIFDRYKHPLHSGSVEGANLIGEGANPVCGDEIRIEARIENGIITEMKHACRACAICTASADLLIEEWLGKSLEEARSFTTGAVTELVGIPLSPLRIKCALLPLETLKTAVEN
ncbi:MAG: system FeS assembly protein NifU family [Patescibacteria group bacterium]|jgi:nitrogen fixation NifU-like protein|nr:system FeS assembly protein NifU family [Patescibacteria group bacterium]